MYLESRLEKFYNKGIFKNSAKFTGKHLHRSLFWNKAAGCRPAISLNTESGTGAFLLIFWNLYKNIYFANVCEGLPLKSKIFTGVSFRKILGFYYKRNRQLFYYKGTSSRYISLKIPERVNKVIFQNSYELFLLKIPQTKTCSKSTKEYFKNVIRVPL